MRLNIFHFALLVRPRSFTRDFHSRGGETSSLIQWFQRPLSAIAVPAFHHLPHNPNENPR
jgi:hypothetical protein